MDNPPGDGIIRHMRQTKALTCESRARPRGVSVSSMTQRHERSRLMRSSEIDYNLNQRFYSVAELAEALNLSRKSIHRLIARGDLGATKLGRDYRIPASAAIALVDAGRARAIA